MRLFYTLLLLSGLFLPVTGRGQADSASFEKMKPKDEKYGRQLRFNFDISRPVINLTQDTKKSYEAGVDFYVRKEVYAVAEGGFGSAIYEYPDLSYRSNSSFFRVGIDKSLIKRLAGNDWDAAFIGARYCMAFINRQEASYTIVDSLWGNTSGIIPAHSFTAHWAEVTGGVRVELLPHLMAGWNVRARFLLSDKAFRELSPVFIAGYGKGDQTTQFDFNFYICYALRWGGEAR